jgi:hypothetical protein
MYWSRADRHILVRRLDPTAQANELRRGERLQRRRGKMWSMMKEAEDVIEVGKEDPGGQRVNQPRDLRADRSVDDGQMGNTE